MKSLRPVFLASFFFSVHIALLSYLNSTVLALHTNSLGVTLAYTVSSALSLVCLIGAGHLVRKTGSSVFLIGALALSVALLAALGTIAQTHWFVSVFVVYFSLNTVIWYAFDLVIEHYSKETNTGNIRGIYLTLNNTGWVLAPIAASAIVGVVGVSGAYIAAAVATLAGATLILTTKHISPKSGRVPRISFTEAFRALARHPYARRIVTLYFVIQFFFAWMVIYLTPHLQGIGFSFGVIGIILSTMLLPFVLFQYWTGKVVDKYRNEQHLLALGFLIAGIATYALAFPLPSKPVVFSAILFVTRIGASIIEVAAESAFFKHVTERDTALISTLRMTIPLAYIIAPLTGALVLAYGSIQLLFGILASILVLSFVYATRL